MIVGVDVSHKLFSFGSRTTEFLCAASRPQEECLHRCLEANVGLLSPSCPYPSSEKISTGTLKQFLCFYYVDEINDSFIHRAVIKIL